MNSSTLNKSLSVFIPFYNEENSLEKTVNTVLSVLRKLLTNYELILINDGSSDSSLVIANNLAKNNSNVFVLDLITNQGFGKAYLAGLKAAKYQYCLYLTADGDVYEDELFHIINSWSGKQPLIQYAENPKDRSYFRFLISNIFTQIVNLLSGLNWPYYNGFNIYKIDLSVQNLKEDFGFCTQAYVFINLMRPELTPLKLATTSHFNDKTSKSLTFKNFTNAIAFFVYILKKRYESIFR